jgi:hypothetical protein
MIEATTLDDYLTAVQNLPMRLPEEIVVAYKSLNPTFESLALQHNRQYTSDPIWAAIELGSIYRDFGRLKSTPACFAGHKPLLEAFRWGVSDGGSSRFQATPIRSATLELLQIWCSETGYHTEESLKTLLQQIKQHDLDSIATHLSIFVSSIPEDQVKKEKAHVAFAVYMRVICEFIVNSPAHVKKSETGNMLDILCSKFSRQNEQTNQYIIKILFSADLIAERFFRQFKLQPFFVYGFQFFNQITFEQIQLLEAKWLKQLRLDPKKISLICSFPWHDWLVSYPQNARVIFRAFETVGKQVLLEVTPYKKEYITPELLEIHKNFNNAIKKAF